MAVILKYTIIAPVRTTVNLAEKSEVEKYMNSIETEIVVYAAGVTNVDEAEREKEYAMRVNTDAISWIKNYTTANGIPLVVNFLKLRPTNWSLLL